MTAALSWLFVPGDSARKIERALQGEAEALIFVWEDSVAAGDKSAARDVTAAVLAAARVAPVRCWIRLNALASPEHAADLAALPAAAIAGIVLPRCCDPTDVERIGLSTRCRRSDGSMVDAPHLCVARVSSGAETTLARCEVGAHGRP